MDEFSNQLIEAPEDEDIDDLNDETFGDSGNICECLFNYLKMKHCLELLLAVLYKD
jgi:hypothetical protein